MPSPERGLITAVVDSGEAHSYLTAVKPDWFFDTECRRAWGIIVGHYEKYRESISRRMLTEQLPGFTWERYTANVDALRVMVEDRWISNSVLAMYEDLATAVSEGKDARMMLAEAQHKASTLMASVVGSDATDTDIAATAVSAAERYFYRKTHQDEIGLPFPWAPMQRAAHGARNGNFILLFARQKSMKTYVMLYMLMYWRYHYHRKVLFITREMTPEELQDRDLTLWAKVDSGRFEGGELDAEEEERLQAAAEAMAEVGGFIVEQISGHGGQAVAEIAALVDKYELKEGDILAVDGMYFFAGESEWQKFRAFSQGLKRIGLTKGRQLIVLATSQGNRNFTDSLHSDAGKEMGMGDAPTQDCDIAVKLALDPEEEQIRMMMTLMRRGKPCQWIINAKPSVDFTLKMSDAPDEDRESLEDLKDSPIIGARRKLAEKVKKKAAFVAKPKTAAVAGAAADNTKKKAAFVARGSANGKPMNASSGSITVKKKSAAHAAAKKPSTPPAVAGGTRKKT